MSFILDALKKSESARQRQAGPSLFEVKVAAPRRGLSGWALGLGALLLINAAVLGWMLLRRPTRQAVPGGAVPGTSLESPPAPPSRGAIPALREPGADSLSARSSLRDSPLAGRSPLRGSPAAQLRAVGGQSNTPSAPAHPGANPGAAPAATPAGVGPGAGTTASADTNSGDYAPAIEPPGQTGPGTQVAGARLPRYQDLATAPGGSLPPLHLDLHVYDADRRKRYVMINMQSLRQGDSLPDGVAVVSIRPDGVVLSYEGRQFLLPR